MPLKVHGYDPSIRGSGAEVDLLLHGRMSYHCVLFEPAQLLIGVRTGVSGARVSDGDTSISGLYFTLGPDIGFSVPLERKTPASWMAGASFGPTYVLSSFKVDENMKKEMNAFGLAGHVWLEYAMASWFRVGLDFGLEYAFTPKGDPTFFNSPLGDSLLLTISLGAVFSLGRG